MSLNKKWGILLLVVVAVTLFLPSSSLASNDYPWSTADPNQLSPLGFNYRNCTDFVAWRLNEQKGVKNSPWVFTWSTLGFPVGKGNAVDWKDQAITDGYVVNHNAAIGAVAWWGAERASGLGHVAIVQSINSDGSSNIEQYNAGFDYNYSTAVNQTPDYYLHIADVGATIGLYDPTTSTLYLRNSNTPGPADTTVQYGNSGWEPVVGDWDGNGTTTLGVYSPTTSTFYLRNSNIPGPADNTLSYGNSGWVPISGNWDGRSETEIGVYDPVTSTFYLKVWDGSTRTYQYGNGNSGWEPVVGDWNGDGTTTIGVYNPANSTFYLSNDNANATIVKQYGNTGWIPFAGDWSGNRKSKIGIYDPVTSTFYLSNDDGSTTTIQYGTGNTGWKPIVGHWGQ